jgi:hypothetical protein
VCKADVLCIARSQAMLFVLDPTRCVKSREYAELPTTVPPRVAADHDGIAPLCQPPSLP